MNARWTILWCLLIAAVTGGVLWVIANTEPTARRGGATKRTAMLVELTTVEKGDFQPHLITLGTVRAERSVDLAARVEGQVVDRAPALTPGGMVDSGSVLLQLDPADYRLRLQRSQADLARAQADLVQEEGRGHVAEQDLEAFAGDLPPERRALALREPQMRTARSQVEAAQAAVDEAQLALDRTTVRAPFQALVLERHVEIGSQVARGEPLARLVGIDRYWVEATIPLSRLRWLRFPEGESDAGGAGATVTIRNRTAWPTDTQRTGTVQQLIGDLDRQTRLARVLIAVDDPLALSDDQAGAPRLLIGEVVEAAISARTLEDVVRMPRDLLRSDDTVWVFEGAGDTGTLSVRSVEVLLQDRSHVYISDGLDGDARVVTSDLATVVDGAPLRLAEADQSTAHEASTHTDTASTTDTATATANGGD